jgi:hypothetical protein
VVKAQLGTDRAKYSDQWVINYEHNGVGMSNSYLFI